MLWCATQTPRPGKAPILPAAKMLPAACSQLSPCPGYGLSRRELPHYTLVDTQVGVEE